MLVYIVKLRCIANHIFFINSWGDITITYCIILCCASCRETAPLPDSGQWLVLLLNEQLPSPIVAFLRAPVSGLHHFLMLFLLLAFSVLYGCAEAPGLGIGARYMFTMGVGRLIRVMTFATTILPSARPWCAYSRFKTPNHPHPWAQKYYMPYAQNHEKIREVIDRDMAFGKQ